MYSLWNRWKTLSSKKINLSNVEEGELDFSSPNLGYGYCNIKKIV